MGTESKSPGLPAAAFARILDLTQTTLMRYLRRLLGNDEDARDLVQDVYIEAWHVALDSPCWLLPGRFRLAPWKRLELGAPRWREEREPHLAGAASIP
jgi:hypothetical protein